jgi:uncharacterized protein (DUF1684 family)
VILAALLDQEDIDIRAPSAFGRLQQYLARARGVILVTPSAGVPIYNHDSVVRRPTAHHRDERKDVLLNQRMLEERLRFVVWVA